MASVFIKSQEWFDFRDANQTVIGVHTVKLRTASGDTFRVPTLAEAHATASAKQLQRGGDPTVTVAASDADSDGGFETITVTGAADSEVIIVTLHTGSNFAEDEDE